MAEVGRGDEGMDREKNLVVMGRFGTVEAGEMVGEGKGRYK